MVTRSSAYLGLGTDTAVGVNPDVLSQGLAPLVKAQVLEELLFQSVSY
jgi:hypothetical protein